jgi:membrane protease YdiL (CAAX protease family)
MLDLLLVIYLILFMPAQQIWRSLRKTPAKRTRLWNYGRNCFIIGTLLVLLAVSSVVEGRTAAALGLRWPPTAWEWWAIAGAAVLLGALHLIGNRMEAKLSPDKRAAQEAKLLADEMLPRSARELVAFVIMAVLIGFGWEVLYRGFLLLILTPYVGDAGAITLAALAYGVGHGFDTWKQLIGSIAAALAFTLAYYLSHSLWWLIVFHSGVGILFAYAAFVVQGRHTPLSPAPLPDAHDWRG